jgi:LAGLIDADG endonuclease
MSVRIQHQTRQPKRLSLELGRAYCAGLLDGEGCIHIARQLHKTSRRGYTFRLRLSISQNHLGSLLDFQNLLCIEGRVYQVQRTKKQNRDCYQLCYDGERAREVIEVLHPYLLRKLEEADAALEFMRVCHVSRHFGPKGCPPEIWRERERFYRKLRNLK